MTIVDTKFDRLLSMPRMYFETIRHIFSPLGALYLSGRYSFERLTGGLRIDGKTHSLDSSRPKQGYIGSQRKLVCALNEKCNSVKHKSL